MSLVYCSASKRTRDISAQKSPESGRKSYKALVLERYPEANCFLCSLNYYWLDLQKEFNGNVIFGRETAAAAWRAAWRWIEAQEGGANG